MEILCGIILLLVFVPPLFRLLGAVLRSLGSLVAVLIVVGIVLGIGWMVLKVITSLITGAANLIFGPLGLLLAGSAIVYMGYRAWKQRQITDGKPAVYRAWPAESEVQKPKRGAAPLELGDDGEIVTLDELLADDDDEALKRQQ